MECRKVFSTAHVSNSVTFDMYNNTSVKVFHGIKGALIVWKIGAGGWGLIKNLS